jgi:hypothetical protein
MDGNKPTMLLITTILVRQIGEGGVKKPNRKIVT